MFSTRRQLLAGSIGAAGALALGRRYASALSPDAAGSLGPPEASGIDHVVVVMMENRSFDHFLGWLPKANGKQDNLWYSDRQGVPHPTHHLTEFQGCGHPDPDHSFEGGRIQFNGGRCDGWLRSGENDEFSIGYYTADDLPFYAHAATEWTACDNYFSAIMAETYPNRFYQHAAQTDRIHNSTTTSTLPTIWDRLADAGLRGRYYFSDVPFTALWGSKYVEISHPFVGFLADCASGNLPEVAFVDPRFLDEGSGTSGDDHPHADIRAGQSFLNTVYEAVTMSPAWPRTLLIINYDEWGGFYDHAAPKVAPDAVPEWGLRGFRVPCLVISPRARRRFVAHGLYDHTSVLKLIEWRWGLAPLSPRDAAARNLAEVLDLTSPPNVSAARYSVPPFVGLSCAPAGPVDYESWEALQTSALDLGWSLG